MPRLKSETIVKEYVAMMKQQLPHLTKEQITTICWKLGVYIKEYVRSDDLPIIKLKYFGRLMPIRKKLAGLAPTYRAKGMIEKADWMELKAKEILDYEKNVLYKGQKRGIGFRPKQDAQINFEIIDDEESQSNT